MDFYIAMFDDPVIVKSCLAGTTVQEVADSNGPARDAANVCFVNAIDRFKALLDETCRGSRKRVDTTALAALWTAAVQGSLILAKASQYGGVIRRDLEQVKDLIASRSPHHRHERNETP